MKNAPVVLFFKSHVDTYTRKDGSVVHAHDDKRTKREEAQRASNGGKDWRDEENWHSRMQGKMKTHSEAELRYIHKDATEAAEIGEKSGHDPKKTGQYRDEAHYAAQELHKRSAGVREAKAKYDQDKASTGGIKPGQSVMFEHPERGRKVAGTYVGVRDGQSVVRHEEDGEFKVNHADVSAR